MILAAIYSLFGPIQVVAQALLDFDPLLGVHPPPGSPLFIPPNVVIDLAAVLTFAGLLYYWQRQRPAAAVFGFSLLLQLPGVVNSILGTTFPIPGLGPLDTILSAAIFLWCLLSIVGAAPRVPTLLWALWIGLTILTHFNTLVPDTAQSALFTIFAVLPVAYTLLWAAEPLNKTAKRAPEQATLALGLMATLLIVVSVQIWLGDRFGRIDNTFIHDGSIFQLATAKYWRCPFSLSSSGCTSSNIATRSRPVKAKHVSSSHALRRRRLVIGGIALAALLAPLGRYSPYPHTTLRVSQVVQTCRVLPGERIGKAVGRPVATSMRLGAKPNAGVWNLFPSISINECDYRWHVTCSHATSLRSLTLTWSGLAGHHPGAKPIHICPASAAIRQYGQQRLPGLLPGRTASV